jgi:hypothetical protein
MSISCIPRKKRAEFYAINNHLDYICANSKGLTIKTVGDITGSMDRNMFPGEKGHPNLKLKTQIEKTSANSACLTLL